MTKTNLLILAALLPANSLNAAPAFNDNPIAYGKVAVQSWKTRRDFNIVKQDLDYSCGAASVATLLNNFYGQRLTEAEVLKKLDKNEMRASFEDMRRIMPELGFEARGYALSFEQLAQLKIPVIVYLKYCKTIIFRCCTASATIPCCWPTLLLGIFRWAKRSF